MTREGNRWNVIVVVADTLRTAYIGAYGNEWIRTPNMDRLASEGVLFTRAHPECLPTIPMRRTMHTGRRAFPFRDYRPVPWDNVYLPGWQPMSSEEGTIAEALVQQGVGGYALVYGAILLLPSLLILLLNSFRLNRATLPKPMQAIPALAKGLLLLNLGVSVFLVLVAGFSIAVIATAVIVSLV